MKNVIVHVNDNTIIRVLQKFHFAALSIVVYAFTIDTFEIDVQHFIYIF